MTKKPFKARALSLLIAMTWVVLFLSGCGKEKESEIAKGISISLSSNSFVVPNSYEAPDSSNCPIQSATGPRARVTGSIQWNGGGQNLKLYIYTINLQAESTLLKNKINLSLASELDNDNSLSGLFGLSGFIPPDNTQYFMSGCALEIGGLPGTAATLTGSATLKVPLRVFIYGLARDANGNEFPFTKETKAEIVYTGGSIVTN
jgi:hypothetical protein